MFTSDRVTVEQPVTFVSRRHSANDPVAPARKGRFHAMAKPIGSTCNIDCSYCYYLFKEHLLQQHRGRRMDGTMLERCIRQYIEAQNGDEVIFSCQGGEPTMLGIDFFRDIVALQKTYLPLDDGAVIIAAGSVVTRKVRSNVLAAGVPCREIREITEKDKVGFQL